MEEKKKKSLVRRKAWGRHWERGLVEAEAKDTHENATPECMDLITVPCHILTYRTPKLAFYFHQDYLIYLHNFTVIVLVGILLNKITWIQGRDRYTFLQTDTHMSSGQVPPNARTPSPMSGTVL